MSWSCRGCMMQVPSKNALHPWHGYTVVPIALVLLAGPGILFFDDASILVRACMPDPSLSPSPESSDSDSITNSRFCLMRGILKLWRIRWRQVGLHDVRGWVLETAVPYLRQRNASSQASSCERKQDLKEYFKKRPDRI